MRKFDFFRFKCMPRKTNSRSMCLFCKLAAEFCMFLIAQLFCNPLVIGNSSFLFWMLAGRLENDPFDSSLVVLFAINSSPETEVACNFGLVINYLLLPLQLSTRRCLSTGSYFKILAWQRHRMFARISVYFHHKVCRYCIFY